MKMANKITGLYIISMNFQKQEAPDTIIHHFHNVGPAHKGRS